MVEKGPVMFKSAADTSKPPGLNRGAWFTLVFAFGMILLSAVQLLYRFTLPTDGWDAEYNNLDELNWLYLENLVGAESDLRPGDILLQVDDQVVVGTATSEYLPAPQNWQFGKTVAMRVTREGSIMHLTVPVVHWTREAIWQHNTTNLDKIIALPVYLILFALGLFTFLKRPGLYPSRALLLISACLVATYISNLLPDGLSTQFDFFAHVGSWYFNYSMIGTLLIPSVLVFALHFPKPKRIFNRYPWLGLSPYIYSAIMVVLLYFLSGSLAYIGWIGAMLMVLLTIASLIHAYITQRDAVSRAQLRWVLGGFLLSMFLLLMAFPPAFGWIQDPELADLLLTFGFSLAFILITLSISLAILRYRLFDIDIIIRKTLQYTLLTGLLALVYFGSVIFLQGLVENLTGEQSPLVIVLSTLAIAALFNPLRTRIQDFIDRRFYRKKYDAEQALAHFAAMVRDEVDMEKLTGELLHVVNETMQPEQVSLWLGNMERTQS